MCACVCMHVHVSACVCMCVHVYACVCGCAYVCVLLQNRTPPSSLIIHIGPPPPSRIPPLIRSNWTTQGSRGGSLALQPYQFKVIYRPVKANGNADALSRQANLSPGEVY